MASGRIDPLRGAVADVALVPQRLVLQRRLGVAAQQPRLAGDPLRQDRVALVGHRRAALLARLERLHDLGDLGVLEVPDLGRDALEGAAEDRDRGEERGVPVALDDLGAHRVRVQAEVVEHLRLEVRRQVAVRADRAADLAGGDVVGRPDQALPAPGDLERPAGALEAERRRLRVDGVGPAHHHGPGLAPGPGDERQDQARRRPARRRSPAARSWSASPVSTTSLLVRPRWR